MERACPDAKGSVVKSAAVGAAKVGKLATAGSNVSLAASRAAARRSREAFVVGQLVRCKVAGRWVEDKEAVVQAAHRNGTYDVQLGDEWSGMLLKGKDSTELRPYDPQAPPPPRPARATQPTGGGDSSSDEGSGGGGRCVVC